MASVSLAMTFQNGTPLGYGNLRRFTPGEIMQGVIYAQATQPVTCRALTIWPRWYTRGKGDQDSGSFLPLKIFEGNIAPTAPYSLPFQLRMPNEPWTYNGHYIAIIWEVVAEADCGFRQRVRTSFPFALG